MSDDELKRILEDISIYKKPKRKKPKVSEPTKAELQWGLNVIYVDFVNKKWTKLCLP